MEPDNAKPEEQTVLKQRTGGGVIPVLRQCASHEQFLSWINDLESYFKCEQIADPDRKYSILMIHGGPFLNEIVRARKEAEKIQQCLENGHATETTTDPEKSEAQKDQGKVTIDTYESTKKILLDNYVPNSNITVERLKFRATQPSVGDSHREFLEKLSSKAQYCGFDNGYSSEDAIVEQFMDKCLWGHLKTRLSFESKLTVKKILEIAEEMRKCMPAGKDLRFEKPGSSALYKTFPNKYSLESKKGETYKPYKLDDLYDRSNAESIPDPAVPCVHCQKSGHVSKYCILKDKQTNT